MFSMHLSGTYQTTVKNAVDADCERLQKVAFKADTSIDFLAPLLPHVDLTHLPTHRENLLTCLPYHSAQTVWD